MTFNYSKTIWNKIGEAHKLIINNVDFNIESFEEIDTDKKKGVDYTIIADAYLDYAFGVCDAMDINFECETEDGETYNLKIFIKNE